MEMPAGVVYSTQWHAITEPVPAIDGSDATWFEGTVTFACEVTVANGATPALWVTVDLQACNEEMCRPPVTLQCVAEPRR